MQNAYIQHAIEMLASRIGIMYIEWREEALATSGVCVCVLICLNKKQLYGWETMLTLMKLSLNKLRANADH